jgi:hypothetical protein
MRARWYDSSKARFLSRDPINSLAPTKINPYQYAEANPLGSVDPLGLDNGPFLKVTVLPGGQRYGTDQLVAQYPQSTFFGQDTFNAPPEPFAGDGPLPAPQYGGENLSPDRFVTPHLIPLPNAPREGFAQSFKRRNYIPGDPYSPETGFYNPDTFIPGDPYNPEAGFYRPDTFNATPVVGLANFDTRIRLTFNNIGVGVALVLPGASLTPQTSGGRRSAPEKLLAIPPPGSQGIDELVNFDSGCSPFTHVTFHRECGRLR